MFISPAFAQEAAATGGGFGSFIPLLLVLAIFYFLILRPQQKKFRAHEDMIKSLKRGDQVLTAGGIIARISKVDLDKNLATLTIATGVDIDVRLGTISEKIEQESKQKPAANASEKAVPKAKAKAKPKAQPKAKAKK